MNNKNEWLKYFAIIGAFPLLMLLLVIVAAVGKWLGLNIG